MPDIASGVSAAAGTACMGGLTRSPDSTLIGCATQAPTPKGIVTGDGLGLITAPTTLIAGDILAVANYIAPRGNEVGGQFAFSPDSSQIAFSLARFNARAFVGTLYVAPVADATARVAVLQRANAPVWGASGIAASRVTNVVVTMGASRIPMVHSPVWTVNPDGSGARRITNYRAKGLMSGPSASLWVSGGARIIGTIGGEDVSNLATFAVLSGASKVLVNTSISNPAAVTPDGQRVLCETGMDGRCQTIRMIGINGKGRRVLARQASGPSVTVNWNA